MRQHLALVDQSRCHDLRNHEPEDSPGSGDKNAGNPSLISIFSNRSMRRSVMPARSVSTMARSRTRRPAAHHENSPGNNRSAVFLFGRDFRKYQRVIRSRTRLNLQYASHVFQRIAHRPMHLRHTAQTVCVLHARIVLPVRLTNLGACKQFNQVLRARICPRADGPGGCADRMPPACHQRLQAHSARQISQLHHAPGARHGQCPTAVIAAFRSAGQGPPWLQER